MKNVNEIIGTTKTGKVVKLIKRSKDFTIDDHNDAMNLISAHPQRRGISNELYWKLEDLYDYHFRKFKAIQEGVKVYRGEGNIDRSKLYR